MDPDQHATGDLPEDMLGKMCAALEAEFLEAKRALKLLLEHANKSLGGQAAAVLTPVDNNHLRFYEATDEMFLSDDFPTVPIGASIAGFVFLSAQTVALEDAKESAKHYAEIDARSGFNTKEYLATPIIRGDVAIGVLTIANRSTQFEQPLFSGGELQLAERYANLCGLILEHVGQIREQTSATANALRASFSSVPAEEPIGVGQRMSLDDGRNTGELRAQVNAVLGGLTYNDLELVHDLVERLVDRSSVEQA